MATGTATPNATTTLDGLNALAPDAFVLTLGGVFEHAPWVAEAVLAGRPFARLADLAAAMRGAVAAAGAERQLALLRGHPELAGAAAKSGNMTAESVSEQAAAGLDGLGTERAAAFDRLNAEYRERFGFPFIICVRRHGRDSVLSEFRRRVALPPEAERETALAEVFRIAALRLDALVDAPDRLPVSGRLSCHVLDVASGVPAAGVAVELLEIAADGARTLGRAVTNANGRTDAPLVSDRPVPRGVYELRFALGDYYRGRGVPLADPPFLDMVPIRFGVADPEGHYHVPLTASPWSFFTYRGS